MKLILLSFKFKVLVQAPTSFLFPSSGERGSGSWLIVVLGVSPPFSSISFLLSSFILLLFPFSY